MTRATGTNKIMPDTLLRDYAFYLSDCCHDNEELEDEMSYFSSFTHYHLDEDGQCSVSDFDDDDSFFLDGNDDDTISTQSCDIQDDVSRSSTDVDTNNLEDGLKKIQMIPSLAFKIFESEVGEWSPFVPKSPARQRRRGGRRPVKSGKPMRVAE